MVSPEDLYKGTAIHKAIKDYYSQQVTRIRIPGLILLLQTGHLLNIHKIKAVRLTYYSNYQDISRSLVHSKFKTLIKLGLIYKSGIYYTLTPLGWQHYNLIMSLYTRYYNMYDEILRTRILKPVSKLGRPPGTTKKVHNPIKKRKRSINR